MNATPFQRIEFFYDWPGRFVGTVQSGKLAHRHAVRRRAGGGGVLARDQRSDRLLQLAHGV